MYQSLAPARILETLERPRDRIDARFPDYGVGRVGHAREAVTEIENLATGLARKIWRIINLIGEIEERAYS